MINKIYIHLGIHQLIIFYSSNNYFKEMINI